MSEHEQRSEPGEQPALPPPPRIWIGSLADYNAGELHGEWINAAQAPDNLQADVQAMLSRSPTPGAEEWGIFDHDGFQGARLDEYESLEVVSQLARGIAEHGGAFAAWADLVDNDPEQLSRFEEAYLGRFDNRAAFAQQIVDDLGVEAELQRALPGWLALRVAIDLEGIAQDLELSGDISMADTDDGSGGVWVFDGRV